MDHKKAVGELLKGRAFANQLKILVQDDSMSEAVHVFVTKILESLDNTLAIITSGDGESTGDACESPAITQDSSPFASDEIISVHSKDKTKLQIQASKDRRGGYKRRKITNSWTEVAPKPFEDGYGWRKYGQKEILNARYPRNYFRCTHKNDQGCQATKQVQKIGESPPMYQTTYVGHHTCKNSLKAPQFIPNSLHLLEFKPTPNIINSNKKDCHPLLPSFPSIKLEPKHDQMPNATMSSDKFIYSSDFNAFEASEPTVTLPSSPGSDQGDVISSVCPNTENSDLEWMLGVIDFKDEFLDEEFFQDF